MKNMGNVLRLWTPSKRELVLIMSKMLMEALSNGSLIQDSVSMIGYREKISTPDIGFKASPAQVNQL